ncbi:hypothetical protein C8F01DRAFT_1230295 [Mycena amicta]|nr:hypothetical protein C8F01DRAFT_1230295 [Mycena amicta]
MPTDNTNRTSVLIAGAGPSGRLILAMILLKNGVSVRLIDKERTHRIGSRGAALTSHRVRCERGEGQAWIYLHPTESLAPKKNHCIHMTAQTLKETTMRSFSARSRRERAQDVSIVCGGRLCDGIGTVKRFYNPSSIYAMTSYAFDGYNYSTADGTPWLSVGFDRSKFGQGKLVEAADANHLHISRPFPETEAHLCDASFMASFTGPGMEALAQPQSDYHRLDTQALRDLNADSEVYVPPRACAAVGRVSWLGREKSDTNSSSNRASDNSQSGLWLLRRPSLPQNDLPVAPRRLSLHVGRPLPIGSDRPQASDPNRRPNAHLDDQGESKLPGSATEPDEPEEEGELGEYEDDEDDDLLFLLKIAPEIWAKVPPPGVSPISILGAHTPAGRALRAALDRINQRNTPAVVAHEPRSNLGRTPYPIDFFADRYPSPPPYEAYAHLVPSPSPSPAHRLTVDDILGMESTVVPGTLSAFAEGFFDGPTPIPEARSYEEVEILGHWEDLDDMESLSSESTEEDPEPELLQHWRIAVPAGQDRAAERLRRLPGLVTAQRYQQQQQQQARDLELLHRSTTMIPNPSRRSPSPAAPAARMHHLGGIAAPRAVRPTVQWLGIVHNLENMAEKVGKQ